MSTSPAKSTQAAEPSLERSEPEHHLARTLGLCEAQMESALNDSDLAVDALVKAFTGLAESTRAINAMTQEMPPEAKALLGDALQKQAEIIARQIASAVVAFQFYDKLTQRLGHVRYSLSTLAMFVCDRSQAAEPDQWERLLKTLRRLYRTEEERKIFQMIMDGMPMESEPRPVNDKTSEVELF
jgi:Trp operon repressor